MTGAHVRHFDGTPESARRARRFAAEVLDGERWARLIGDAELCVGELAANAVLHTRAPYDVVIAERRDSLRVEVIDARPEQLPVAVPHSGAAADLIENCITGRGLRLVGAVAMRWGVTTTATTKSVWIELGEGPRGASAVVVRGEKAAMPADAVVVDLRRLPVLPAIASGMQVEGLVRELQLGFLDGLVDPDERLRLETLLDRSAPARLAGRHAAVQAAGAGVTRFDLTFPITRETMDAFAALAELLVEIPRRVHGSDAAPSEEVIALREWIQEEVVAQVRGGQPRACPLPA